MLTISQKRFFVSLDELALLWNLIWNSKWSHGRPQGGKTGISPLEIGITNQIYLENPEVGILIPINWFDSCNGRFFCRYETHTAQESGSQI